MKLWLQVLFGQGYLWRDRFPASYNRPAGQGGNLQVLSLAWSAVFLMLSVRNALDGSLAVAAISIVTSLAFMASTLHGFPFLQSLRNHPFWVSVAWAGVSVALLGVLASIAASILIEAWAWVLILSAFLAFCAAGMVNQPERRYLFFCDPGENIDALMAESTRGIVGYWRETYWRLPRQTLKAMFRGPRRHGDDSSFAHLEGVYNTRSDRCSLRRGSGDPPV